MVLYLASKISLKRTLRAELILSWSAKKPYSDSSHILYQSIRVRQIKAGSGSNFLAESRFQTLIRISHLEIAGPKSMKFMTFMRKVRIVHMSTRSSVLSYECRRVERQRGGEPFRTGKEVEWRQHRNSGTLYTVLPLRIHAFCSITDPVLDAQWA